MTALDQEIQTNNWESKNQMKRSEYGIILGSICLSLLAAIPTHGAINVTETSDWSANLSSPYVIPTPLGLGINTISGTLPLDGFGAIDCDVIQVNNPSGFSIASIQLSVTSFSAPSIYSRGRLSIFQPTSAAVLFDANANYTLPATFSSPPSLLDFRLLGPSGDGDGSANYMISITATPVPEPVSAVAAGLAILAFAVWRKRNRA
jgi:hypothetical protein